jgi:outer membrane protein assembly factor BamD
MKKFAYNLLAFTIFAILTGCSTHKKEETTISDPALLFKEGTTAIQEGNYKNAISSFETIEREHPTSKYAAEAAIRRAYSYYLNNAYDDAIFSIEDFLRQYPSHSSVEYMYYLKALCFYEQMVDIERDQQLTQQALEALDQVIVRFPKSKYALDAKFKRDLAFNQLAGKEMKIGMFYLKKGITSGAITRFKTVIDDYDTSIFVPEALYRMVEIYYSLGVNDQAIKYASVLNHNFRTNDWNEKALNLLKHQSNEPEDSLTKKIIRKVW